MIFLHKSKVDSLKKMDFKCGVHFDGLFVLVDVNFKNPNFLQNWSIDFRFFFFILILHTIEHKTRYSLIFETCSYNSLNFGTLCPVPPLLPQACTAEMLIGLIFQQEIEATLSCVSL